jgi:hypothetical protein
MTMLLIFATPPEPEEPPSLPDLHIMDASTMTPVPVGGLEGHDNDFLQVQALGYGPMEFTDEVSVAAGASSSAFWARRLSTIVIKSVFSEASQNAVVRPVWLDRNNVEVIGEEIPITGSDISTTGGYFGGAIMIPTYGANKAKIRVTSISSGTLSMAFAGV